VSMPGICIHMFFLQLHLCLTTAFLPGTCIHLWQLDCCPVLSLKSTCLPL
jgi:hypothetical protein